MSKKLSRREFLKLMAVLPSLYYSPRISKGLNSLFQNQDRKNILVILFDTLSSSHIPFYGYSRETTPFISELAEKAIVYQNHYAGGNYTTPGTASLLTGTSSLTHRALAGNSEVIPSLQKNQLFNFFAKSDYSSIAYTHNTYTDTLLKQFRQDISEYVPSPELFLSRSFLLDEILKMDYDIALLSKDQVISDKPSNSLLLSKMISALDKQKREQMENLYGLDFNRGIPIIGDKGNAYFLLEDAIDWITNNIAEVPPPFFGYFHLMPPHSPYRPRNDFIDVFKNDGVEFDQKPDHLFSEGYSNNQATELRQHYDEFILNVDFEFNRLYQTLQASGVLDNTILILTSDHGELFERGMVRHGKATLHDPVIRVPLLIFMPGQEKGIQITTRTTAMDVLPTLLHLSGQNVTDQFEGEVLPPFNNTEIKNDRSFYMVHADTTQLNQPISVGTAMIIKENYKLVKYFGYDKLPGGEPFYEMFDLEQDPEELNNIYSSKKSMSSELLNELELKLLEADKPYQK